MQNIPILEISSATLCLFAYIKYAPLLRGKQSNFEPIKIDPDQLMSWSTRDGAFFEDIETYFIQGGWVTFRHKFGTVRIAVESLDEASRSALIRNHRRNHPLAPLPLEGIHPEPDSEIEAA